MNRLVIAVAIVALAGAASAQKDKEAEARRAAAAVELAALAKEVEALPKEPRTAPGQTPLPILEALKVGRKLSEFAKLYDDLAESAAALVLKARADQATGDPVAAVVALAAAAQKTPDGAARQELLVRQAELRAAGGDVEGAINVAKQIPPVLDAKAATWQTMRDEQKVRAAEITQALNGVELRKRDQARFVAVRFVETYPMATDSGAIANRLHADLAKSDPAESLAFGERLALYHRGHQRWGEVAAAVVATFAVEGEYERAYLHALRMLEASERVPPAEVAKLPALLSALEKSWTTAAARTQNVDPKTKRTRYPDLIRRARGGDTTDVLREDLEAFEEDYPTSTEISEIRLLHGLALLTADPERAAQKLGAAAAGAPNTEIACTALLALAPLLEKEERQDEARKLLEEGRTKFTDPGRKTRLGLELYGLLKRADHLDEAKKLAETLLAEAPPELKEDVEEATADTP